MKGQILREALGIVEVKSDELNGEKISNELLKDIGMELQRHAKSGETDGESKKQKKTEKQTGQGF